jgi:hypothetical protein
VALAAVAWFNLVSAVVGMAGLTLGGGLGIPLEWIEGSVFDSYFWPGVILGVVVGGAQVLALVAQYGRYRLAWGLHAAAGLVMMIWIFVEIAIMLVWSPLHGIYFVTGLLQTVLAVLALGAWPRPFGAAMRSAVVMRARVAPADSVVLGSSPGTPAQNSSDSAGIGGVSWFLGTREPAAGS